MFKMQERKTSKVRFKDLSFWLKAIVVWAVLKIVWSFILGISIFILLKNGGLK